MFISFKRVFDMLSDIDNNSHQITELKQAVKKLQTVKTKQADEPDKKPNIVVNMSRASAGLTLLTIQVFDQNDELVNVITTTSTTAHINGSNIKVIKDGDVNTFGKREYK